MCRRFGIYWLELRYCVGSMMVGGWVHDGRVVMSLNDRY